MKRIFLLLAALLFALTACAEPEEAPPEGSYELYYAAVLGNSSGGDAIGMCSVSFEDGAMDTEALAKRLMTELLRAPEDDALRSPFPSGTALQRLSVAGGRAAVDLSEAYARLSGVDLSIADYCVTLTLTQLDGVNAVRITADGRELPYRKTQLLTAADPLLSSLDQPLRPINVSLYFLDTVTGELRAQQQTLALYEGQSRVSAVLDALLRGPEDDETLAALLGADFSVLSGRIDEGVCYVNMKADAALPENEAQRELALSSLEQSLLSLSGVDSVQILVDGEAVFAPEEAAPSEG